MKRIPTFLLPLLSALILVPLAVVAVAGVVLLQHERDRLGARAAQTEIRWLTQAGRELEQGLEQVRATLEDELISLPANRIEAGLEEIHDRNPLARNVFRVSPDGRLLLPPQEGHLDDETQRFLQRYASLFEGRTPWFNTGPDQMLNSKTSSWNRIQTQSRKKVPTPVRSRWKTWRWEEADEILVYIEHPQTGDIVGIELERSALFSRLDVWLRNLARPDEALLLRDGTGTLLIASSEPQASQPGHTVPLGPLLGFAHLEMFPRLPITPDHPHAFFFAALGIGSLLVLSILTGTLGLTAWLRRSRREAMQKTTFVSNVSHEFKTPLTTLRLYSELLLEERVTDPEKKTRYLRTLRDESERLARLVHNVLDFSRLEMGRNRFKPQKLSFNQHLEAVVSRLQERLDARGLEMEFPQEEIHLMADSDGLEQILLNWIENAIQYARGATRITAKVRKRDAYGVEIELQDDGPGIPAAHRRRVFQAFHQVDDSLTRESGGTGLGLHISRRIARQMGGNLTLCPATRGACFLLTLPPASS